jgi:hypothetical protein
MTSRLLLQRLGHGRGVAPVRNPIRNTRFDLIRRPPFGFMVSNMNGVGRCTTRPKEMTMNDDVLTIEEANPILCAAFHRVCPTTITPSLSMTIGCRNPNRRMDSATASTAPSFFLGFCG